MDDEGKPNIDSKSIYCVYLVMSALGLSQRLLPLISGRGLRARVRAKTHPDSP